MSSENQDTDSNATLGTHTRRTVLERGAVVTAGVAGLGTLASQPVVADYVVHDEDSDEVRNWNDEVVGAMELGTTGPDDTTTDTLELGASFGISTAASGFSGYKANGIKMTFTEDGSNPDDHSCDNVQPFEQGDGSPPELVQMALDTMWELTSLPAPNPLDLLMSDSPDVTIGSDLDSFTIDYNTETLEDYTGGVDFNLHLGVDGSLDSGWYYYDLETQADVWYYDSTTQDYQGTLKCHNDVAIYVK